MEIASLFSLWALISFPSVGRPSFPAARAAPLPLLSSHHFVGTISFLVAFTGALSLRLPHLSRWLVLFSIDSTVAGGELPSACATGSGARDGEDDADDDDDDGSIVRAQRKRIVMEESVAALFGVVVNVSIV